MAKSKRRASSNRQPTGNGSTQPAEPLTTYFRRILQANPKLLDTRSNQELIDRWQADHPGKAVSKPVQAALANAKSAERHQRRKKGRRKKGAQPQEAMAGTVHALPKATTSPRGLERLEEQIDDCLSLAKHTDREGLAEIIHLLRRARNQVVWKMGQ